MANEFERLKLALAQRYRVEHEVGRGGMATVYRAHDLRHDRAVALKVLRPELAGALGPERFLREITLTARLDHPHILPLLDSGEAEGFLYYVMPYVEGESLRERLNRERQLPLDDALQIAREVADALSHAHSLGIVHRDIKPENVLLAAGHARVADFGIGRAVSAAGGENLTETGIAVGTLLYMSPEQASGEREVDARTDVYGLACVVYEMLAGQPPYTGATPEAILARKSLEAVPSLRVVREAVPPGVEEAITKALAKVPADRFVTASKFADALASAAAVKVPPALGVPAPSAKPVLSAPRTNLAMRAVWAIGAVLLALASGWWGIMQIRGPNLALAGISSLAVLPLDDLSGDHAQDYFADGITEALITDLGRIGTLRVTARQAVMRYKGGEVPLRDIARELGVDALVTGSVTRSGDRVRITIQLIDPSDERQLWSQSYAREMRDIVALHTEIAHAVAEELQAKLTPAEGRRLSESRPIDPEAYETLLRARYLSDRTTQLDMEVAIAHLERAVALDPGFATAYADLAMAYVRHLTFFATEDARDLEQRAFAAAERALSLDPDLASAYVARGDLFWTPSHRFAHARSVVEYRRALSLNPSSDDAHRGMSRVLVHVGLLEEGLWHADEALKINPANGLALVSRIEALQWMGNDLEALATLSRLPVAVHPELAEANTTWSLLRLGRREEAWDRLRQAMLQYPDDAAGVLAGIKALLLADSDPSQAQEQIHIAADRRPVNPSHHASYFVASAWARMGRVEEAVRSLRQASEAGFPCYPLFANDPILDPIRQDPRFHAFLNEARERSASLSKVIFPESR